MKKLAIILVVTFFVLLGLSSCNDHICPTYVKANTEQVQNNS